MDSALKQRLIGATVLVALAVIFLPMLVDGPESDREEGAEQLSLELPQRPDRPLETREIPLLPAPGAAPAPAAAPASDGAEVLPVVDTAAPTRVDAVSGEVIGGSPAAPSTPGAAETSTSQGPAAATPSSTPPTVPPPPASPSAAVTSTPAPPPTKPATPPASTPQTPAALPAATAGGAFAVNVGSYANTANAENLLARLKAAGIAAYAESTTLDGRPVRRIRLGPFAQRGEAERARQAALAVDRGLPTSIINLDAGEGARAPARPAAVAGYAVQLGALRSEADANALRDRARGAGFAAFVERVNADAGVLWRVRVGPELDRASADRRREELKSRLGLDGLVVSHP
jgi:DedD protein